MTDIHSLAQQESKRRYGRPSMGSGGEPRPGWKHNVAAFTAGAAWAAEQEAPIGNDFRYKVQDVLKGIEDLLVEKNESYGNAALEPLAVFSKASAEERLNIAIDNKLNRLYSGKEYGQEDTAVDLIGYLVLREINKKEKLEADD